MGTPIFRVGGKWVPPKMGGIIFGDTKNGATHFLPTIIFPPPYFFTTLFFSPPPILGYPGSGTPDLGSRPRIQGVPQK